MHILILLNIYPEKVKNIKKKLSLYFYFEGSIVMKFA